MAAFELKEKLTEQLDTYKQDDTDVIQIDNNDNRATCLIPQFEITFAEAQQRIALLQKFVREMMVPGQDYGTIPRCEKPTLFKPGAEKLCDIYGFSKRVEIMSSNENWSEGIFSYTAKVTLISKRTGLIEAEGIGCCNNREKKYATQDPCSTSNTVMKMAKKRALVDAVLSATRSSGLFTQDIEDFEDNDKSNPTPSSQPKQPNGNIPAGACIDIRTVTPSQLTKIQSLVSNRSIPINKVKEDLAKRYGVAETRLLTLKQASDFIQHLLDFKAG